MELKDLIKTRRERKRMTMKELATKIGVSEGTISRWESGDIANMRRDKIQALADALDLSPGAIMGWEKPKDRSVLVFGHVAAGIPIEAIEDVIGEEEVSDRLGDIQNLFGLRIKGDSMTPMICDGDIVIVRKQDVAESGDIVIATINGDDAVCKRLLVYSQAILLRSLNPAYDDIDVSTREDFRIWGKVIELRRKFESQ